MSFCFSSSRLFSRTLLRFDKFDVSTTVEILVVKDMLVFSPCELIRRLLKSTKGISFVLKEMIYLNF